MIRRSCACLLAVACGGPLDAGSDRAPGLLPVGARNPVVLCNDGAYDNWQGEYAALLAATGGPEILGIVVNASVAWPDLESNLDGWRRLVAVARDSGLESLPDPVSSAGEPLVRPDDAIIESTQPNRSQGAEFIVETSLRRSDPRRPLVVVTGGRLTDVADAYLIDPTLPERVVIVASLGALDGSGARMGRPNGEMDPWADAIVVEKFRYVQVSAYYDHLADVPTERVSHLPANPLGAWIAEKRRTIFQLPEGADQVGIAALGVTEFVREVQLVAPSSDDPLSLEEGPTLEPASDGSVWLVTGSDGAAATARFWELLGDPATYDR